MLSDAVIDIIDFSGKTVRTQQFSTDENKHWVLQADNLDDGVYAIRIQLDNGVVVKRFVKR